MTETQLMNRMIQDYHNNQATYDTMERYYNGDHDINYNYKHLVNKSNLVVIENFVNKFINEEVQYSLGNPLSYVSKSGDTDVIDAIYTNTFHWKDNHNQELMRQLEIFGTAYALYYIDNQGRFCERVLTPKNAICYCDTDGVPKCFIHFYKLKYDDAEYRDVYWPDGRIVIYKNNTKIMTEHQPFDGIPVSVCKFDRIEDTIFYKIKSLQDGYNQVLSDQGNNISDLRNSYLVITGVAVSPELREDFNKTNIINPVGENSKEATVQWLNKDFNDTFIENYLERTRNGMYELTSHIDANEKLQSNTSGTALRNRLVFLEQRCNMILSIFTNTVYDRLSRLFEYLEIKGQVYDITDIKISATPCIPVDEISIIQGLVQLGIGTNISRETALSRLPFIENPAHEIEKINQEQAQSPSINLDSVEYESLDTNE